MRKDQFRELVEEYVNDESPFTHSPGVCRECEQVVMIDLSVHPHGQPERCEQHLPLSDLDGVSYDRR